MLVLEYNYNIEQLYSDYNIIANTTCVQQLEKDPVLKLTESSLEVEQLPPRKRQNKFCKEISVMGQDLSDGDINIAQHLLFTLI